MIEEPQAATIDTLDSELFLETLTAAHQYVTAGLSLLPIRTDGSKMPDLTRWKHLQSRLPTQDELQEWFWGQNNKGLAVIGGQVSRSLEILDFDDMAGYQEFLLAAEATGLGPLINRLRAGCEEASPNGVHLPYYCQIIEGNKKLAKRPATLEELQIKPDDPIKGLIETRGEGGYVIVAPSSGTVHLSGKPYYLLQGSWLTVATITPEERADLWDLCRTFDQMPPRLEETTSRHSPKTATGTRPGDLYAAAVSWTEILEPAGWTWVYHRNEVDYWRRPGKNLGVSATTNYAGSDYFYCFSSSTLFDAERGYGKFSAFAWLHHKGDFHAASFALMKKGYGLYSNGDPKPMPEEEEWTDIDPADTAHVDYPSDAATADTQQHAETSSPLEEEENTHTTAEEREECPNDYPCPEELWIGPFADVADIVGVRDWRVWMATAAALSARAHRNVHATYYGDLYAMGFFLLVAPSGTGKGLVTRLFKHLLPDNYRVFTSVESGQALPHILADIIRDDKSRITGVVSAPTALAVNEWSMLLSNSDIAGSTLMPRLCDVYDAEDTLDIIRSDKRGTGNISVPNPTLTICGTTTTSEFHSCVKPKHVRSGLINRHFVLPGPRITWSYNSSAEFINYHHIENMAARLPLARTLGVGQPMGEMYTPEAYDFDEAWAHIFFDPIHNPIEPEGETVFRRLHVYNRRIALLYAWATGATKIHPEHVTAAHLAVETSYRFLQDLFATMPVDLPAFLKVQENVEELILDLARGREGIRKDAACQQLRRHGGYTFVSQHIEKLLEAGALRMEVKNRKRMLHRTEH